MHLNRQPNIIINLLMVVCFLAIWYFFAPGSLGGRVEYVIVNGNSMEPDYQRGDLVIIAQASSYQVGDVVTYRDNQIEAYVIHRIIGEESGRYILKGDNNSWIDNTRPDRTQILGKQWLFIPKVGQQIFWLRKPLNMALVTLVLGGGIIFSMVMQSDQEKTPPKRRRKQKSNIGILEYVLYGLSIFVFLFLVLTIFSFTKPVMDKAAPIPYQQTGVFSYSANGSTTVYDDGQVETGEPVYLKSACVVDFQYSYSFNGPDLEFISGTNALSAVIQNDKTGWKKTLELSPRNSFNAVGFVNNASLDLCNLISMIRGIEEETGVRNSIYSVIIQSEILVEGILAGVQFRDMYTQPLYFKLDDVQFYLSGNSSETKPSFLSRENSIDNPLMVEKDINFLGTKISVKLIRALSILGMLISLCAVVILWLYIDHLSKVDRNGYIRLKYGQIIIETAISGWDKSIMIVDVVNIDELAKIANRHNTMILHTFRDAKHFYLVENEGTVYRYFYAE